MKTSQCIGIVVREAKKRQHLTQAQLASQVGVGRKGRGRLFAEAIAGPCLVARNSLTGSENSRPAMRLNDTVVAAMIDRPAYNADVIAAFELLPAEEPRTRPYPGCRQPRELSTQRVNCQPTERGHFSTAVAAKFVLSVTMDTVEI